MAKKPIITHKPKGGTLTSKYGVALTPAFLQTHVGAAEHQALKDLYAHRTGGGDLAAQSDPQAALQSAGLIHTPNIGDIRLTHPSYGAHAPVYASAADAVDALKKKPGGGGGFLDSVGGALSAVGGAISDIPGAIGSIPNPFLVNIGKPLTDVQKASVKSAGGSIYGAGNLGGFFELYTTPGSKLRDLSSFGQNPARVLSGGSSKKAKDIQATYDSLVNQQKSAADAQKMRSFLDSAKQHQSSSEVQAVQDQVALGPLGKRSRFMLLKLANKNGWAIADPRQYSDSELARRAFTLSSNTVSEVLANAVRQEGQLASLPAGLLSVGTQLYDAAKSGDLQKVTSLGEQFVQPYTYYWNDVQRKGFVPATSAFIRERPVDAALLASGLAGIAGKGAGAAVRTGTGVGETLPQRAIASVVPAPAEGSRLAALGERARVGRTVNVEQKPLLDQAPLVTRIGTTGTNLLGALALDAKASLISRGLRSDSSLFASRAKRVVSKEYNKTLGNIATSSDAAGMAATAELRKFAGQLNFHQRERLIGELMRVRVLNDGTPVSLADLSKIYANKALAATDKKQAQLYRGYADRYQQLADVPLDQNIIDAAIQIVAPLSTRTDMLASNILDSVHIIDAVHGMSDPSGRGLSRVYSIKVPGRKSREITYADLKPNDVIDISGPRTVKGPLNKRGVNQAGIEPSVYRGAGQVRREMHPPVPAIIDSITPNADGSLTIHRTNILDQHDVASITVRPSDVVVKVAAGVVNDKYVRDFQTFAEDIKSAAGGVAAKTKASIKARIYLADAKYNPLRRLDRQRLAKEKYVADAVDALDKARVAGSRSGVTSAARRYRVHVEALKGILGKQEKAALAVGENDLAVQLRNALDAIIQTEQKASESITQADIAASVQGKLLDYLKSGEVRNPAYPYIPHLSVEQPAAASLLERAAAADTRAAGLRKIEQQLIDERNAAPSAAKANDAAKRLAVVEDQIASLMQQSDAARFSVPSGFASVLDNVETRFDAVSKAAQFIGNKRAAASFAEKSKLVLPDLLSVLSDLRGKLDQGLQISKAEVDALIAAEASLIKLERKLTTSKSYSGELVVNAGKYTAKDSINTNVANDLAGVAAQRSEYASGLRQTVAERAAAPSFLGPYSVVSIRKMRKAAEGEASRLRREAAKIVETGMPIFSTDQISAAIDAASNRIAIKLNVKGNNVFFPMDRMPGESVSEAIARASVLQVTQDFRAGVEAVGGQPYVYVPTATKVSGRVPRPVAQTKTIDALAGAGLDPNRLKVNTGQAYAAGIEDLSNLFRRSIGATGAIVGSDNWTQQMRGFLDACFYHKNIGTDVFDEITQPANDWVVFSADRRVSISNEIHQGSVQVENMDNPSLADLFSRVVGEEKNPALIATGGDYYVIPRYLYEDMTKKLADIAYRPTGVLGAADKMTKFWRTFTLNIIPRTGAANLGGSVVLAALAGCGPRAFYMAYKELRHGTGTAPSYLRQGYVGQFTNESSFAGIRSRLPTASIPVPGLKAGLSFDTPFAALAWWMNTMRRFNAVSEDFGRFAVYYSKAIPAAERASNTSFWTSGRILSNEAQKYLELLAAEVPNNPAIAEQAAAFTEHAFQWLGDLHAGGKANTTLRILIPFHQWYRHIIRLTFVTMPLHYPGRALFLQRLGDLGHEYLIAHGVYPGWMMDVLPIMMEEKTINNVPQKYIMAWHTGSLNPFSTTAQLATGTDTQAINWIAGMANPMIKGMFEIGLSALQGGGGKAQQIGGAHLLQDVKNQDGNPIGAYTGEGLQYYLNTVQQMVPLSTLAVTTSGQAADGNLLWNQSDKLLRGSGGAMPLKFRPQQAVGEVPGRDLLQLVTDFSSNNALAMTARVLFGGSPTWVVSHGPVEKSQFAAAMNNLIATYKKELSNTMKTRNIISQQLNSGQPVPPVVEMQAPAIANPNG